MHTLYLHIGLPKTGTTSIQRFCENNREKLKTKGYLYPEFEYLYPDVANNRNAHFLVGVCRTEDGKRNLELEKKLFQKGLEMIEKSFEECDKVIISDEAIWHKSIKHRKKLWNTLLEHSKKNKYQIKIIVYLRRQDELALSYVNQKIKSGKNRMQEWTWEYFIENSEMIRMEYDVHLDKIEEVFGKEALCVRIFEKGQFQGEEGNLYSDFLDIFGLDMKDYVVEKEYSNTSLSYNGQEIKRIVNEVEAFDEENRKFIRNMALKSLGVMVRKDNYSYLSMEERNLFMEKYEAGNQYVAKKYFGRDNGKLFSDINNDKEKWTPHNPHMQEDIVRFFAEIVLVQQKAIRQLREEQRQMRQALEGLQENRNRTFLNGIKQFYHARKKND